MTDFNNSKSTIHGNGVEEISSKEMLKFLESFEYISVKYKITKDYPESVELKKKELLDQGGKLKKISPSYIASCMRTLYDLDADRMHDSMIIFDSVYKKVINEFLAMPGLESLFDEHFYNSEWDMHTEYDFAGMSPSFYRDHVEHQVRNMYAMLMLLDKFDFLDSFISIFNNPTSNKISDYIRIKHQKFINDTFCNTQKTDLLNKCAQIYFKKELINVINEIRETTESVSYAGFLGMLSRFSFKMCHFKFDERFTEEYESFLIGQKVQRDDLIDTEKDGAFFSNFIETTIEFYARFNESVVLWYIETYSMEYIIRSACIICALFHDISYPLCHFNTIRRRIRNYMPSMHMFIQGYGADIDRVISILKPSLLFNIISEEELRKMLDPSREKWDHGVYSAIALLLQFYESGRINQLSADKQAALELAAVAIYNHNLDYGINKKDEQCLYYRPVYYLNPISFLLKLCDDLQEWDRKYFEFSTERETVFCPYCLSPVLYEEHYDRLTNINDQNSQEVKYELNTCVFCKCDRSYKRKKYFPMRNMYTVTVCDNLKIWTTDIKTIDDLSKKRRNLVIKIDYNPLKMLHMAKISTKYAFYRQNELKELKNLLDNQLYYLEETDVKYNSIILDYIMTCNPVYLKSLIFYNYLSSSDSHFSKRSFLARGKLGRIMSEMETPACESKESLEKELLGLLSYKINRIQVSNFEFCDAASICEEIHSAFAHESTIWKLFCRMGVSGDKADTICRRILLETRKKLNSKVFQIVRNKLETAANKYVGSLNEPIYETDDHLDSNEQNPSIEEFFFKNEEKLKFYLDVAITMECKRQKIELLDKDEYSHFLLDSFHLFSQEGEFANIIKILIKDCCKLIYDAPDASDSSLSISSEKYHSFLNYDKKDEIFQATNQYCNPLNWCEEENGSFGKSYAAFSEKNLDYHSDLFIFEALGS